MEEAILTPTDNSENSVLSEDKGNSNSKKSEKSGGSKLETGKSGKLKPAKKPVSPTKPSISATKNLTKPSVKSEADNKSKTKPSSLSNGKPKHEEKAKPATSHNVVKETSSNKTISAPAQSTKKTTSATSTTINSKASPAPKTVKTPVETKQKTAITKKPVPAAGDVHEATKLTPDTVSKVNPSKSESKSSSKPKVIKSKPLVDSSKEANPKPVASKPTKPNVSGSAKPLTKLISDVKVTVAKPPSAKVSEKPAPVKSTTVSKQSQPGKVVKKVPAKENATKKSKGDSKALETKSELLHITNQPNDTLTGVTDENSSNSVVKIDVSENAAENLCEKESCEVIEQLASNSVLNEEKNFDVFLTEHERHDNEENLQLTESSKPDEINLSVKILSLQASADDEAPAVFTNSLTYISSEETATEIKNSAVNDSSNESVIEVKDAINHSEFAGKKCLYEMEKFSLINYVYVKYLSLCLCKNKTIWFLKIVKILL